MDKMESPKFAMSRNNGIFCILLLFAADFITLTLHCKVYRMCFQAKSLSEKSPDLGELVAEKKCKKRREKREKRKEKKKVYVENPTRFRTTSECVPEGPLTPLVKSPASSKGKIPR